MKHIIVVFFASLISTAVFSQGIEFEKGTFQEALDKAKAQDKLLFMDSYTTWCGPCKMMSKDVFPQKKVGDFFNEHFVSIKIDMEKGEGIGLRETYDVNSFPTLLFLDGNGKMVHKLIGGMYAEDLIKGAKNVVDPNKRLPALAERYTKGDRGSDFLINYIEVLHGARDNQKSEEVAKVFVANTPISEFNTPELFRILDLAKIQYGSANYWYLENMKEQLVPLIGKELYFQIMDGAIRNYLYAKVETSASIEELNAAILETKQERAIPFFRERMEKNVRYVYYLENNDLEKWVNLKLAEAKSLEGSQEYVFFVHDLGTEMVNNPKFDNATEAYNKVLKIGHEIADQEEGVIMGSFLLAKLYLKMEDKKQALKYFNMFYEGNKAAGGNITHVTVTDLKKEIDNL